MASKTVIQYDNSDRLKSYKKRGKIKWFSTEKQFGFLIDENGVHYYFNLTDLLTSLPPRSGDLVDFVPGHNKKGPRAGLISLAAMPRVNVETSQTASAGRVKCAACGQEMIPRLVMGPPLAASRTWTPVAKKSICPFCAATHKTFPPSGQERRMQVIQWGIAILVTAVVIRVLI